MILCRRVGKFSMQYRGNGKDFGHCGREECKEVLQIHVHLRSLTQDSCHFDNKVRECSGDLRHGAGRSQYAYQVAMQLVHTIHLLTAVLSPF